MSGIDLSQLSVEGTFSVAWPVWAGGYPTPDEALTKTRQLETQFRQELQSLLSSQPGLTLTLKKLSFQLAGYQPIAGLSPLNPQPNSQEVTLVVYGRSQDKANPPNWSTALPPVVENLSNLIKSLFVKYMPGGMKGANIYDVRSKWNPHPDMVAHWMMNLGAKSPKPKVISVAATSPRSKPLPRLVVSSRKPALPKTRPLNPSFVKSLQNSRISPYVILRPRLSNQFLYFDYEDSSSTTQSSSSTSWLSYSISPVATPGWPGAPLILVPLDLDSWLETVTKQFAIVRAGHDELEVLPVFVGSLSLLPAVPFDLLAERLPPILSRWPKIQIVRLARDSWQRRAPFQLPIRVGSTTPALDHALDVMRGRRWYAGDPAVQEFGLQISTPPRAGQTVSLNRDLLFCATNALPKLLAAVEKLKIEDRPRLVIAIGNDPLSLPLSLPAGVSILVVPSQSSPSSVGEFIKEFLYGIIHDCSLPAALKAATSRAGSQLNAPAILISDPLSIQDLRLKDALVSVLYEALDLHTAPSMDPSLDPLSNTIMVNNVVAPIETATETADSISAINGVLNLNADFSREHRGLVPIARARQSLQKTVQLRQKQKTELAPLALNLSTRKVFTEYQERRVDITVLRDEPNFDLSLFVRPGEKLQSGADYLVRVQIGRRSPASVIIGEVPTIDPILPNTNPKDGHYLHLVLFAQDFTSRSPQMCRVFLPRFGNSDAAVFAVTAPLDPGLARLRVGVYYDLPGEAASPEDSSQYRNQLVQMFLLETNVGDTAYPLGDVNTGLGVKLEFSRTSKFANLDQLSDRRLSIAINDDPKGSHRLLVKGDNSFQDILWSETAGDGALKSMRQLLEKTTWDDFNKGPRFPENPPQKPEAEFDKCLKELVLAGSALYDGLWTQVSNNFQQSLRKLRDDSDKVIQITRLATNFLFPWASLYDFDLPSTKPDAKPVDVCKGFTRPGLSCEQCLEKCLFPDKTKTYCVYGFWGTRHKVEQLLHTPFQGEDAITEIKCASQKAVQISVGVEGKIIDNFIPTLKSTLGENAVLGLHSLDEMLKRLWSDPDRPAILLVLGHYETPKPNKPRITFAGSDWFEPSDITQKVKNLAKWKDSNPLIVLAACESASASLASITSFLAAFADARAAAVVGTETTVFEGLACRFAKEISIALMQLPGSNSAANMPCLGNAVLDFRRRLLLDFNPLGLVFTPYGDADLHRV